MTKQEKIAQINAKLTADIAAAKAQKEQTIAEYYAKVAELQRTACEAKNTATDDEPMATIEEPIVWLDGSQHTAAIVARRILRKLPTIPYSCSIDISVNHYTQDMISLQVKAYNPNKEGNMFAEMWINGFEDESRQAEIVDGWIKETESLFTYKQDNSHVAEPFGRALDAIFGGNPVDELNDIVDGVVRKEADNE